MCKINYLSWKCSGCQLSPHLCAPLINFQRDNGSLDNCIIEKTLKVYYSNFLRLVASFGSRLARTNVSTFLNMCDNNFPNWRSHVDANSQWIWTILQELKENQANRSSSVMHNEMENRYMEELARICWRIQELSGQLRVRREKNDEEAFRRAELKARNEFYVDIVARVVEICSNAV